jgi:hypothetical protein
LRYVFKLLKIKTKYKNPSHVGLEIKTKNKNPTYLALFLNPLSELAYPYDFGVRLTIF